MWGSNLSAPPITTDLWTAIRDRLRVPVIDAILDGPNRVYVEGEQSANGEDKETEAWGRIVVVPADPITEPSFVSGLPVTLDFLVRAEVNGRSRPGYSHSYHLQLALTEAFRLLEGLGTVVSTKVMIAGEVRAVTSWRPHPLQDERTGTVFLSHHYQVDVTQDLAAA